MHGINHILTEAQKKKNKQKEESRQNESNDQDKESGTSLAQQHENMTCHCCGEKRHSVSDCPMKENIMRKLGNQEKNADGAESEQRSNVRSKKDNKWQQNNDNSSEP